MNLPGSTGAHLFRADRTLDLPSDAAPDLRALWPALVDAVLLTIPSIPPHRAEQ